MNTVVIGTRLEIRHYTDWSGSAFLFFEDEEYRIPGEVARIIVESILHLQNDTRKLEERILECSICREPAGKALLLPKGEGNLEHAMCATCHDEMDKLRRLGVTHLTHAAAERARKAGDGSDHE
jgi:hypothetical protein